MVWRVELGFGFLAWKTIRVERRLSRLGIIPAWLWAGALTFAYLNPRGRV